MPFLDEGQLVLVCVAVIRSNFCKLREGTEYARSSSRFCPEHVRTLRAFYILGQNRNEDLLKKKSNQHRMNKQKRKLDTKLKFPGD